MARLRSDLTVDPTFNNGNGIRMAAFDLGGNNMDAATTVALQPDGKIVAAGFANTASNGFDAAVLRLNADGTPDASFGNFGRASFDFGGHHLDDQITTVKLDAAGRIWIAGTYQFAGSDTDFLVARLRTDGTLDTDFCGSGVKTIPFDVDSATTARKTDVAWDLLLQSDGKVVLTGYASNGTANGDGMDFAAARLTSACALDPTFGTGGKLHGRFAGAMPYNKATAASFGGSGIILAGAAADIDTTGGDSKNGQFGVAMIRLDLIFANGFETR